MKILAQSLNDNLIGACIFSRSCLCHSREILVTYPRAKKSDSLAIFNFPAVLFRIQVLHEQFRPGSLRYGVQSTELKS